MKNLGGKLGILLLIIAMVISGGLLFFEEQLSVYANLFTFRQKSSVDNTGKVLKLAYLFQPSSLNPFNNDPNIAIRLHDVYEGLVLLDENLIVRPGLAVSYGMISPVEWEFNLREGVAFHDGSDLDVDDVIYSYNMAIKSRDGSFGDLTSSVQSLEKIAKNKLRLVTKKPDPLILNKLAKLPIIPENYRSFEKPVGSGPYQLTGTDDLADLKYERFDQYWGEQPYFEFVEIKSVPDKNRRVAVLLNGQIDFLVNVPPDAVGEIKEKGFNVDLMPSLEIGFVMFNLSDRNFSQKSVRVAIAKALNKASFLDLAYGYAKTLNQFVPNGVFGYNPDLKGFQFDQTAAEEELAKSVARFEKLKVSFYFPEALKLLGQYFKEQLILIGIDLELHPLSDLVLQEKLNDAELPFYYLGWRHDSGDALPFLKAVLHSRQENGYGIYNGMKYKNEKVDQLIEKSEINLDLMERLRDMQEVLRIAVEDDVVGVPLFETQSIFAYGENLYFQPRVDSLIYPSKIAER